MRRLTVDISDELGLKLDRVLDHGYKGKLVESVLAELLDLLEKTPRDSRPVVIGAILSKDAMVLKALVSRWEKTNADTRS